jgi:hypothetical protein
VEEAPPFGMVDYNDVLASLGVLGAQMYSLLFETNVD